MLRQRFSRTARAPLPAGAIDEEDHPRTEQQREQPHELLVDEDLAGDADCPVEPRLGAARVEVEVGPTAEPEVDGVHQQDAEHRNTAHEVEAGYAPGLADGAGAGGRRGRGRQG